MISAFAALRHLNIDFNRAAYTPPATWYVGFRSSGVELSGNGYARTALTANVTSFPTTATNVMSNGVEFVSATASGGNWAQADEVALYDAPTGGNLWYWDLLDAPFTLLETRFRTFAIGALQIRMI
jgi:hypothetical protein